MHPYASFSLPMGPKTKLSMLRSQHFQAPTRCPSIPNPSRHASLQTLRASSKEPQNAVGERILIQDYGVKSQRGTVRKVNEDRANFVSQLPVDAKYFINAYAGVYDGHGGSAVAEWLEQKLAGAIAKRFDVRKPEQSLADAFIAADRALLTATSGFLGLGERGVGGSKCGATAAVAMLYQVGEATRLVTGNIGDARIMLVKANGETVQLSVDHVPDDEAERKRIEDFNPNPKLPLVQFKAGSWRVGGLLALSRAFGDAYLKGSLNSEGISTGQDRSMGYSSGFGLIASPYTTLTDLTSEDAWLVISSDGLYSEEARGGGGGLNNRGLAELLSTVDTSVPCETIASILASTAVDLGSTDDVTVVVIRLGASK